MVYSASFYSAQYHYGNKYFFLFKQIMGVIMGIFAMIFFMFFDYHLLKKFKWWIVGVTFLLLLLVFVPGLGVESYGAKRWISLLGFSIQPSEIAKFALVIFIAAYMSDHHDKVKTLKGLLPVLIVGGITCLLIMLEPSMSVTMCIAFVTLFMLIIGGMSKKHTLMFSIPAGAIVPLLIILEPYRLKRLLAFIDPWASPQGEGFQLIQSLYSLGDGGWFGVGLFNSRQKYRFLPFSESDFILSVIGEETGFFGTLLLFLAMGFLIYRGIRTAKGCDNFYGYLLSIGITTIYAIQVLINALVVTGSIPPTGLPLPLISAGNTSIMVFMGAFGTLYNISKNQEEPILHNKQKKINKIFKKFAYNN